MGNNEDLEKGLRFHKEFTAMRQYIRENQIRDYDAFARYCREHKAGWAELLEDPGRTDTVKGYLEFLQVRAGKDQAGGLTHVKKAGLEGEEEDADCGAEQTPVPPYAEMRKCIRENKIADLDEFVILQAAQAGLDGTSPGQWNQGCFERLHPFPQTEKAIVRTEKTGSISLRFLRSAEVYWADKTGTAHSCKG